MISQQDALIYTMVMVSAADSVMTDAELSTIGEIVSHLPVFRDYDRNRLTKTAADCADLLTIAPASAAHKHAASLGLKTLPTPKQLQASDVVLAYRRSARASPHMGALIAAFAE